MKSSSTNRASTASPTTTRRWAARGWRPAALCALGLLLLGGSAHGWSQNPHRVIGHVAAQHLTPSARAAV
ncbi:MAG: hypothetical protein AAF772_17685, partial [Acidobacteriota bacterium]